MNKNKATISKWQFFGFLFTSVLGIILHFLYDWTKKCSLVAPFSAINESTWEHMKLLFFPMFLFAIFQSQVFGEKHKNFWCVKLVGILLGLLLIPTLFYTYTGILGTSLDWINISIFFMAAAVSYFVETKLFEKEDFSCASPTLALVAICLIGFAFIIWTYCPPDIPLFQDPSNLP